MVGQFSCLKVENPEYSINKIFYKKTVQYRLLNKFFQYRLMFMNDFNDYIQKEYDDVTKLTELTQDEKELKKYFYYIKFLIMINMGINLKNLHDKKPQVIQENKKEFDEIQQFHYESMENSNLDALVLNLKKN